MMICLVLQYFSTHCEICVSGKNIYQSQSFSLVSLIVSWSYTPSVISAPCPLEANLFISWPLKGCHYIAWNVRRVTVTSLLQHALPPNFPVKPHRNTQKASMFWTELFCWADVWYCNWVILLDKCEKKIERRKQTWCVNEKEIPTSFFICPV